MRVLLKPVSLVSISLTSLLLVIPFQVAAENNPVKNGEMRLKIDRIGEDEANEHENIETELDKKFPGLFQEETNSIIKSKQENRVKTTEELEQSLFKMSGKADTTLKDTKQALFASDYTAPKTSSSMEDKEDGSSIGKNIFIGLAGLVVVLCGGIYIMMRNLSD